MVHCMCHGSICIMMKEANFTFNLYYRQGYLLSLRREAEKMEFPGGTGEMESGISRRGSLKPTGNFPRVTKSKLCGISKVLGFRP